MTAAHIIADPVDDSAALANVRRLAIAQALTGANAAVIFATGSIVGATIAPNVSLATLPLSIYVLGLAFGTLPTGWIAQAFGRRTAFIAGTTCGAICGLLAAMAILLGSFALFCFATFLGGLYGAVSQSYRFAATDSASVAYRPKAISWVMAGGVFAGFLGPQLVEWTMNIWQPYMFAVTFLVQTVVALIAMAVLAGVRAPPLSNGDLTTGRPLREIVTQPRFIAAALCGAVSFTGMNFLMTSAPLAMKFCGLSVTDSNFGIQWHMVAMFGPSFFTGSLITRFGAAKVAVAGLLLEAVAAFIGIAGVTVLHFWAGLIVVGIGWNFSFIGASALIVATHRPQEAKKVQALNDFIVFGMVAAGSFLSGQLLTSSGWTAVNIALLPTFAIALAGLAIAPLLQRKLQT